MGRGWGEEVVKFQWNDTQRYFYTPYASATEDLPEGSRAVNEDWKQAAEAQHYGTPVDWEEPADKKSDFKSRAMSAFQLQLYYLDLLP